MVNQKAISFKIDLGNLEAIDGIVKDSYRWTNRNRELNNAVAMYIKYQRAKVFYNEGVDPGKIRDFFQECLDLSKNTITKTYPVEVLSFVRGDNLATIATNGMRHVSQEFEVVKEHTTLKRAIAYLEGKGYVIDTSNFQSI